MSEIRVEPTEKQIEFITSNKRYSCYSGGFGSGKTFAGCLRGLMLSQFPGNVGLIGRLTYVELRDTTRKTFFDLCPSEYYDPKAGGKWSPSENYLRLVNGSEILFRHLDTISEKELLSLNIGWFYIDQAEEITENVFRILQSRLRLNRVPNRYGFITCNPEPGNWIHHKFKKPKDEGRLDPNYQHIDSSSFDNPHLPKDYLDDLMASYPEEMRKRFIEGRWDVIENQIYTEFDMRQHVVKPFTTPKNWEYLVALDHGMVNPTCALLGALDHDGNIFIIDEYYEPGVVSKHAQAIHKMTKEHEIGFWLIDPATQAKTREKEGMPWSVIEEYEDYGLFFTPANNEKLAGINRVKEFLMLQKNRRHPTTNVHPAPKLYIFQNCINLITEIQQYKWKKLRGLSERNAPEQSVDFQDHAVDALRYLIMSRFPPPSRRPLGGELVLPEHRKNSNMISSELPQNFGDEDLGVYDSSVDTSLITNSFEDYG